MTLETLREYCLSKPGTEESLPFGPNTLVFKVTGKIFLITGFDHTPLQFNVKCDPDKAIELREQYDCVLPVVFAKGNFIFVNKISPNCFGDAILNSSPVMAKILSGRFGNRKRYLWTR